MKKQLINERDINQRMIKQLKEGRNELKSESTPTVEKKLISERDISQRMIKHLREDISEPTVVNASASDIAKNQAEFRQNVAMDAKFTEFSILPDAGNVIFKGSIPGICEWSFEYIKRDGVEIVISQPVVVDREVLEMLSKMDGVFQNWRAEWSPKLIEYQKSSGN